MDLVSTHLHCFVIKQIIVTLNNQVIPNHEEYFVVTRRYNILRTDALITTHPMTNHIETPDEIDAMFNDIAYGKGERLLFWNNLIISFINKINSWSCVTNVCACIFDGDVPKGR